MACPVIIATLLRATGETGVHTHFRTLAAWLASTPHPVSTVTPYDRHRWLVYPLFAVRRVLNRLDGSASLWWYRHWHGECLRLNLRAALADGQPCVIYAQCPGAASAALRARSSAAQRVVMVAHFNVSEADEWAEKGTIPRSGRLFARIRDFERAVLPRVDRLVFVSAFMQREILRRIPAASGVPGRVIPNFVCAPKAGSEPSIAGDLVCVGTLEPRKNQLYALQIVAAARRLGHPLTLTLLGGGPDRAKLVEAVQQLGIQGDVVFAGHVDDAAALMGRYRACLHVAHMESFGIVLVEAMSRGLPLFAPAVGGITEVFRDEVEGRFIALDDPLAAARQIIEWMSAPERLARASVAAKARFQARFETRQVAQALLAFIASDLPDADPAAGVGLPSVSRS